MAPITIDPLGWASVSKDEKSLTNLVCAICLCAMYKYHCTILEYANIFCAFLGVGRGCYP